MRDERHNPIRDGRIGRNQWNRPQKAEQEDAQSIASSFSPGFEAEKGNQNDGKENNFRNAAGRDEKTQWNERFNRVILPARSFDTENRGDRQTTDQNERFGIKPQPGREINYYRARWGSGLPPAHLCGIVIDRNCQEAGRRNRAGVQRREGRLYAHL